MCFVKSAVPAITEKTCLFPQNSSSASRLLRFIFAAIDRFSELAGTAILKYGLLIGLYSYIVCSHAGPLYSFKNSTDQIRFESLLSHTRCVMCPNQDIGDSDSPVAKKLRGIIYHQIRNGMSDQEIQSYMTQRYGDFILFKPPLKRYTWFLWFGPILFLVIGILMVLRLTRPRPSQNLP